jgi:predicted O-linked N-acetylglucosamine transferase (SPINDLY family)
VTFGSFSNPLKISPATAAAWGAILRRVPDARLRLKYFGLEYSMPRQRVLALLQAEGISLERIQIEGGAPHLELLAAYQQVDMALDTMPYSDGLTTCEALWMGVPVVTLPGDSFASRHSASHLSAAGLESWIAPTRDRYLETALDGAADLNRLAELRASLRSRVHAAPLCDGPRLARHLERLVRDAWRRWASAR